MDPARYAELFRTESREQLTAINRALLELEQGSDPAEPISAIFRAVHTVKGMSATMGYGAVAEFSHELESLLDKMRQGEQTISPELMDALFAGADALEEGIEGATEENAMTPVMRQALERLHDVAGGRSTAEFRVVRISSSAVMMAEDSLVGEGVLVVVQQVREAMLPGVRAFMAVQRLRELGEVAGCVPSVDQLQAATSAQNFTVRLITTAGPDEIERTVRGAGEIESVRVTTTLPEIRRTEELQNVGEVVELDATASAPRGAGEARVTTKARHVRIDLARLDMLLNLVGELVIVRGRLQALTRRVADVPLEEAMADASRLIGDLQAEIMSSRLVPVGQIFDRFPRLVRDVARQLGKEVLFSVEGKDIELDRSLLDEIGEPVVHLLRNAVDHGLELPDVRVGNGKPRAGRLTLSAQRDKTAVLITVRDDGRGIDRSRVLARALTLGIVEPGTKSLDDDMLFRCIAHPGFSTAETVTDVSGRGVGIDAVQAKARTLGGSVELRSEPGKGTTVTIRLPITLAIVRALLARVGTEHYALPLTHVRETLEQSVASIGRVKGREVLQLRDEVLPMVRLREVVQLSNERPPMEEIVIIERGERRAGLVVDELTGQQDIVVKPFDGARDGLALFSGATILADGAPALIMDVGSLL